MSGNSRRYVIVTPFKKADVLAGFCKMNGLDVWVIPSAQGAMVVHDLPVPVFDDWDISELLGHPSGHGPEAPAHDEVAHESEKTAEEAAERPDLDPIPGQEALFDNPDAPSLFDDPDAPSLFDDEKLASVYGDESVSSIPTLDDQRGAQDDGGDGEPDAGREAATGLSADDRDAVARTLAKLSRAGVLVLTSELGEDVGNEEGVSGLVTAQVVDSTGFTADTPAGLIVATGEQILEDLLLGDVSPEDVPGAIRSGDIDTSAIERLAGGGKDEGKRLPPRRPRRFFGRDSS